MHWWVSWLMNCFVVQVMENEKPRDLRAPSTVPFSILQSWGKKSFNWIQVISISSCALPAEFHLFPNQPVVDGTKFLLSTNGWELVTCPIPSSLGLQMTFLLRLCRLKWLAAAPTLLASSWQDAPKAGLARCGKAHCCLSTQEAEAEGLHAFEASYIVSSKPTRVKYEDALK